MKKRFISGAVLIVISVACAVISPVTRVMLLAAAGIICAYEYSRGLERVNVYCCAWVMYLYISAQALLALLHAGPIAFIACFSGAVYLALFSGVMHSKVSGAGALNTLAGVAYPCFLISLLMVISVTDIWAETMILGCVSSLICDAFALFGGMRFGKHKLAPRISPKKTVEGALSGEISAVLFGAGAYFLLELLGCRGFSPAVCILTAVISSLMGQAGDLAESMVKRNLGLKDFSNLIPGHGGMFDRADSLLFAVPTAFLCLYIAA